MKIYMHTFIQVPASIWRPIWNKTLQVVHVCPLTGTPVKRSSGNPKVSVTYSLNGEIRTEEVYVLFDENNPSLTSEGSEAYGASVCIKGTGDFQLISF